jgi:uncharacterized Fe-S cluster protein YjdI
MPATNPEPGMPPARPWRGKPHAGAEITVYFDAHRCRHFAECLRGLPQVFDARRRAWIEPDAASAALVAEVIRRCPSGALHYQAPDMPDERPDIPTSVRVIEHGPFLLRGDLRLDTPGGLVTDTRAALCRCTRSARQPFCDATCGTDGPRDAQLPDSSDS